MRMESASSWLDEAEPEFTGYEYEQYRYLRGADLEVGNIYPKEYARMAYEGMEAGRAAEYRQSASVRMGGQSEIWCARMVRRHRFFVPLPS